jgi:glutamine amidotransferase
MCRWNAYFGKPLLISELLYRTKHGLIDQSLHARMGAETTNGDGFGLGWYTTGDRDDPGRYRSVEPAWSDANLSDLTDHIESPLFMAHVRATSGSPVQQTNCHPFRHGRWLFVHNGLIDGFHGMRRELMLALEPALFDGIEGSTDSEVLFNLGLSFGLEDDPLGGMERAIGFVEATGGAHGVEFPMQGTVAVSNGEKLWALRYSTEHTSRTLFISQDVETLRKVHRDDLRLDALDEDSRVIVSEPISDLPGDWLEVPESTAVLVQRGSVEQLPFEPKRP